MQLIAPRRELPHHRPRLKRGRLRLIHRGVYVLGHTALTPAATYLAAVFAVGEGALLSHRSALAFWGLIARPTGDVDVTAVGRDAGRRRPGIRVHRRQQLNPREATRRQGLPVTIPARTLLDVAGDLTPRELERAFDDGLKRRLFTRNAVATSAARGRDRPGAARLQELAAAERRLSTVTQSEREERFLDLVRKAGLPEPEVNARLGPYTVDFLWRAQRLVVEIDGYEFHSTRKSFEGDRRRDLTSTRPASRLSASARS